MSGLEPEIGHKNIGDYDTRACVFYCRDKGEDMEDVKPKLFSSFNDYVENHHYEEFEYILRKDGEWMVCLSGKVYMSLKLVLKEEGLQV
jgi:Fe-S-cluster containining protein